MYQAADGVALHYDVIGDGSSVVPAVPVVTLAGGAARHPSYLGDLAGLSGLVVPHLRGVGQSPLTGRTSYWEQTADVESLRRHLGLERLTIVAHSAGTRLAISYAARYPSQVEKLMLVTPPSTYLVDVPSDAPGLIDARRGDPVFDAAIEVFGQGPDLSTEDAFNAWQQATAPVGYASWTEASQLHARTGHFDLAAAQAFFSAAPPENLVDRLEAVQAPVLVVAGAQDCLTGLAPVIALTMLFSQGKVAVIEECGHYPWVEQPERFRAIADEFLAEHSADGS